MYRPWKIVVPIIVLLISASLAACQEKKEPVPILLRVDGRTVTLEEFQQDVARTLPPDQNLGDAEKVEMERSILVQLIDRELSLAEADRLGLSVAPAEVEAALQEHRHDYPDQAFEAMLRERGITLEQWRQDLQRGLLMEKVIRQAVYRDVTVDDEEIREYFNAHQDEFDRPEQVRASQIVVSGEEEGQSILSELRQGASFAAMARGHSLSPDSEQGGDLGFFGRGDMPPEFEDVVFSIPVGRLSDLVKSEYGYHLFLVEERREAVRLSFDQVKEQIRAQLLAEKEEQAYQEWLRSLRGKATIEVDWSLL